MSVAGETAVRTRTITWVDPLPGARVGARMSGLDYLLALQRGEIPPPPMMATMGIGMQEAEEGRVVFYADPDEYHYNPIGMVHGGLAATLADTATACAVHSTLPTGAGYTTLELKVNLVRPLTRDTGRVFCEGRIIHAGGRVATAEARLTDTEGKLYAHATSTCMVFRPGAEKGG
jgi:uncharacterized protein (TIGR00369 family)